MSNNTSLFSKIQGDSKSRIYVHADEINDSEHTKEFAIQLHKRLAEIKARTPIKKLEFAEMARNHGFELTLDNMPRAIALATSTSVPHERRPRIDDVRNWCGFDFSGNSPEAQQIRTQRGRQ